jgi:hypothetical protein
MYEIKEWKTKNQSNKQIWEVKPVGPALFTKQTDNTKRNDLIDYI